MVRKEYHDDSAARHYGAEETFRLIVERYNWTDKKKIKLDFVKTCPDCKRGSHQLHTKNQLDCY